MPVGNNAVVQHLLNISWKILYIHALEILIKYLWRFCSFSIQNQELRNLKNPTLFGNIKFNFIQFYTSIIFLSQYMY